MAEEKAKIRKTDAQLAKEQGISRQAVHNRRMQYGWTEDEIQQGEKNSDLRAAYQTSLTGKLGMSVRDYADWQGVSTSEIYRRNRAGKLKALEKDIPKPSVEQSAAE